MKSINLVIWKALGSIGIGLIVLLFLGRVVPVTASRNELANPGNVPGNSANHLTYVSQGAIFRPISLAASNTLTNQIFLPVIARTYNWHGAFAVQLYGGLSDPTGFNSAVSARTSWVRLPISWSDIEPTNTTPDSYNWANLDDSISAAIASNVNLIVTIGGNPTWAAQFPDGPINSSSLNDFKQFIGVVVARYPSVTYWEFYNEPDNVIGAFGGDGAGYAAMLNTIYPVVKSANPSALVVMGGLAMDWFTDQYGSFDRAFLDQVLGNCVQPCFDVANFHYYPVYRATWEPYGRDIIGKANYIRSKMASYGFSRPIINTETGWASTNWGDLNIQGRYVTKTYVRGIAAGLPIINWFALVDANSDNPGLLGGAYPNFDATRPAYQAFQRLTTLLDRSQYVRALTTADTGSSYVEGYTFSVPSGASAKRMDVVWYDCPSLIVTTPYLPVDCASTAPYRVSAARIGVIDHVTGATTILNDGDDGTVDGWVTLLGGVNTNPIYIDFAP